MKPWQTWIWRLICTGFIFLVLPAHAVTPIYTIDTTSFWTGGGVAALGGNGVAAYGQTITAPSDSVLQSFSFFIQGFDNTLPVEFKAYVAGWNNGPGVFRPSSSVLFTSPVMTSAGGSGGWEEVTVNTGNLLLTPGNQYVLFLGTYGLFQGIQYQLQGGYIESGSVYAGGEFVYDGQGASNASLGRIAANPWDVPLANQPGDDAAFIANFQPTPEPGTVTLLLAFSSAGALILKRRAKGSLRSVS